MARILVLVEGQTEELFVRDVLSPALLPHALYARRLGNPRTRESRGGVRKWGSARRDIVTHLRNDPSSYITTLVDYYGMPCQEHIDRGWPGRADAPNLPFEHRADHVESAMAAAIAAEMGGTWNPARFLPYVSMHEFEALLFSDCDRLAHSLDVPALLPELIAIVDHYPTPEAINDSVESHPSRRLSRLIPGYQKTLYGIIAALDIGVDSMAAACPHFGSWLQRLRDLPAT